MTVSFTPIVSSSHQKSFIFSNWHPLLFFLVLTIFLLDSAVRMWGEITYCLLQGVKELSEAGNESRLWERYEKNFFSSQFSNFFFFTSSSKLLKISLHVLLAVHWLNVNLLGIAEVKFCSCSRWLNVFFFPVFVDAKLHHSGEFLCTKGVCNYL